jgi:hypothetical protein
LFCVVRDAFVSLHQRTGYVVDASKPDPHPPPSRSIHSRWPMLSGFQPPRHTGLLASALDVTTDYLYDAMSGVDAALEVSSSELDEILNSATSGASAAGTASSTTSRSKKRSNQPLQLLKEQKPRPPRTPAQVLTTWTRPMVAAGAGAGAGASAVQLRHLLACSLQDQSQLAQMGSVAGAPFAKYNLATVAPSASTAQFNERRRNWQNHIMNDADEEEE